LIETIEFPPPVHTPSTNDVIAENVTSSLNIANFCEYAHICWNIVSKIQNKARGLFSHLAKSESNNDVFIKSVADSLDNWELQACQTLKQGECPEQTFSHGNRLTASAENMYLFSCCNTALLATFENLSTSSNIDVHSQEQSTQSGYAPPSLETARKVLSRFNTPKNGIFVFENL
jgi:hypothetical protein